MARECRMRSRSGHIEDEYGSFGRVGNMTDIGRVLIILGIVLAVAGVVLTVVGRAHLPLGRLPGDVVYRGKNTTIYFPLASSVLISVVISIVLYVVGRWRK